MSKGLSVIHWNINQRDMVDTPAMVVAEIMRQNADVVVLSEFYKTPNYFDVLMRPLQECGYRVYVDFGAAQGRVRQILIAIRTKIVAKQHIEPQLLPDHEKNLKEEASPNFLRIDFLIENSPITIIGTRIKISEGGSKEEQLRREMQFNELLKHIPEDRQVVILGDISISDKYKSDEWHSDNIYRTSLEDRKLTLCTPSREETNPMESRWKSDHLIISEGIRLEREPQYFKLDSWTIGLNYPEHAILTATIKIDEKKEDQGTL